MPKIQAVAEETLTPSGVTPEDEKGEMRMSLHTDGPWEVIAAEFKDDGIVAYEIKMTEAIISKANANLIAAAPEMLDALKAAEPLMTALCSVALKPEVDDHLPSGLKEQINDWLKKNLDGKAIAKAEGKAV